jgi:hypothetical protein
MKASVSLLARTTLFLALFFALAGCPGAVETGDGGSPGTGGGSGSGMMACGGTPATSDLATWANVRDVVDNTCHGSDCHTTGERQPYMLATGSAPLSDTDLYNKLTTFVADLCGNRMLVKPCAPDESAFYLAQAGMCGGNFPFMPFGCNPAYDNCTPADKLEGIRQWIAKGAPKP